MVENQDKYSTKKEIQFLDGIVENKNTPHQRTPGQIKSALQNYISTIQDRRWDDGVDVVMVKRHAVKLLSGMGV